MYANKKVSGDRSPATWGEGDLQGAAAAVNYSRKNTGLRVGQAWV
jgi:hypothetical protein